MLRWTVHLEGGPRRVNHAAVCVGDKVYSFGGYCTGEDYETRQPMDVHVLDTMSFRWKLLPQNSSSLKDAPYQRYGHSAVAYEDCAYIWGGRNDSDGACCILYKYDIHKNLWSKVDTEGDQPGARDGHSACIIHDKMYIYGGYEEWVDRFSDDIYSYCFKTKEWEHVQTKGPKARWRDFHTAIGIGDVMYIFGGRSDEGGHMFTNQELYCNKIQTFDTRTLTWHEPATTGHIPTGRRSHSVFIHEGYMYMFGGYNGNIKKHFNHMYRFNPATFQWQKIRVPGGTPCRRRRQCCCKVGTQVFLFGGTSPSVNHQANGDDQEMEGTLQDLSDLHVLDLDPSLKTLTLLAVIRHKLDTQCLPQNLRWEIDAMTKPNVITRMSNSSG